MTNTPTELEPIVDDILSVIKNIMESLDSLNKGNGGKVELSDAISQLAQLKGIFTMLNLNAALILINETTTVVNRLIEQKAETNIEQIYRSISDGLATLSRYVEYISQKSTTSPQLLLHAINRLLQISHSPVLKESEFFEVPDKVYQVQASFEESDFGASVLDLNLQKIRHLRQMFQVGLIEVIRQSNLSGGFRMMKRSLHRAYEDFSAYTLPDMWVIAQSMIEGYLSGGLTINPQRIKVLSLVDRQYRLVELYDPDKLITEDNKLIFGEMLYLVSLSDAKDNCTKSIKEKYQLSYHELNDQQFARQTSVLQGPTVKDLKSLSIEILEELVQVESQLKSMTDISKVNEGLLSMVVNLTSLLLAVQLKEESLKLSLVTAILTKTFDENQAITKSDLNISVGVVQQLRELFDKHDLSILSPGTKLDKKRLSVEQQTACKIATQHIRRAVQQFDLFFIETRENNSLNAVVEALSDSKSGMKELKLKGLLAVTNDCIGCVQAFMAGDYSEIDQVQAIQLLADAIGSIEFYLETIGKNQTPSARLIAFANESIKELRSMKA